MFLSLKKIRRYYYRLVGDEIRYARCLGVKIGAGCSLEKVVWGSEPYLITIEDRVQLTRGVRFYTHGGAWVYRQYSSDFDFFGRIHIGEGSYLGNDTMIMPGVSIGKGCIVGAGSVVTKSFANGLVIAGNPAKCISSVNDSYDKNKKYNVGTRGLSFNEKKAEVLKRNIFIRK